MPESDGSDRMPPSRISDLRLTPDLEGQKLFAQWTAPGDDYDHGSVTGKIYSITVERRNPNFLGFRFRMFGLPLYLANRTN